MTRIYAACLASYNAGRLYGAWIDCAGKDVADLQNAINDMLAGSPEPNVMRRKCDHCGAWQTDPRPYRELEADCSECGHAMPDAWQRSAEEWAIHDHEGFGDLIKSEWPDLKDVATMAEALDVTDENESTAFRWLVLDRNIDITEAADKAKDVCIAHSDAFDIAKDYAVEYIAETLDLDALPEIIRDNIDYAGIAHDMKQCGAWDEFDCPAQGRVLIVNADQF